MSPDRRAAAWDQVTGRRLEAAYLAGGAGPRGSGAGSDDAGQWRAKRQHLAVPMDRDGDWLDVGCANGHLLATLPVWAAEQGVQVRAHGLELMAPVADLARRLHPDLADRIWTGSITTWEPHRSFDFVTALEDAVPPDQLGQLVERLLGRFVAPGGRLILSTYTNRDAAPRPLVEHLRAIGRAPDGIIHIDRPGRPPLLTVWLDR